MGTMKLLFLASLALVTISQAKFLLDPQEANQVLLSRERRAKHDPFASDVLRECQDKQCKWEEYLEGQENNDQYKRGSDLREELKASKRSGKNWHKDLFDQFYSDCWARVKAPICTRSLLNLEKLVIKTILHRRENNTT